MEQGARLTPAFFQRDVLDVAPELLGMKIVRTFPGGKVFETLITETEAYRGEEDLACHARKGMTPRTAVMYNPGGVLYIYLIYGMYWMMNVVTADKGNPQAVLIRGISELIGPGRVSRQLELDRTFNGEDLALSSRIRIEYQGGERNFTTAPRVGIDYAGEYWMSLPWRFILLQPANQSLQ